MGNEQNNATRTEGDEKGTKGQAGGHSNNSPGKKGKNQKSKRQGKGVSNTSSFKGDVPEMYGKVFQVHSEQRKKGQFEDSLRALELYASKYHKSDAEHLIPLFKELKKPTVEQPDEIKALIAGKTVKSEEGTEGTTASAILTTWEDILLKEQAKQHVAEVRRLKATLINLYNVTWSQCSKLMQNCLRAKEK